MWRKAQIPMVLLSVLITLLLVSPLFYKLYQRASPSIAVVDLQLLVEEEQKHILSITAERNAQQGSIAQKLTVDFAKKLSATMTTLSQECHCIIINKAAIIGGTPLDYTALVRERLKQ